MRNKRACSYKREQLQRFQAARAAKERRNPIRPATPPETIPDPIDTCPVKPTKEPIEAES